MKCLEIFTCVEEIILYFEIYHQFSLIIVLIMPYIGLYTLTEGERKRINIWSVIDWINGLRPTNTIDREI